jgi:hypothetical protein
MTQESLPIGWTKGPGENPQDFLFISSDNQRVLKIGEFVTYKTKVGNFQREILSRITDRQPLSIVDKENWTRKRAKIRW